MKQYVEKERVKKIVRAAVKSVPAEELEKVLIEKIDAAKASAVYPIFPGSKLGFINSVNDSRRELKYEETTIVEMYLCDSEVYIKDDNGDEYTFSEIMENTDMIRTDENRIVTEEPFITTQNLSRKIKEIVEFYNACNERVDGLPDQDPDNFIDDDDYEDDREDQ